MPTIGPSLEAPVDLPRLLRPGLEARPDEVALVSLERRWTWRDADLASDRYAAGLLELGLRPGDRIASLMPNRTALLIHYLACMKAGFVAVPLNYRYMAPEIDHALAVSGAAALFVHEERMGDLERSAHAGQLPLGLIRYEAGGDAGPCYEAYIEEGRPVVELPPPAPSDPAFIFFTSGSTGPSKGVTHSFGSAGYMFACAARAFEMTADDVVLPGSSISHMGGFMFSFAALSVGARAVVARSVLADEILPLLREDRPTVLCMLPSALFALVRDRAAHGEDFASLRLCRAGADKVPAELEREFIELTGHVIDEGYGCSEAGLITLNPPSGLIKIGSVGVACPGHALAIRDDGGAEVPAGADGNLWIRTPSLMAGYWDHPDATQAVMRDGWFDTGDVMRMDAEGYLQFRGRKKQIIVHDGSNIAPQEVEDALLDHHAVESAGVVGVHDLMHGENVRAYITLRPGAAPPSTQELIRFARERIGYKAPEEIAVLDAMPLNPTGKVDRLKLKKLAEEQAHREAG
jgi:acyl-CoA synthetase (AMP-forming)/AMP-acid ligase II